MLEDRSNVGWVGRTSETRRLLFLLLLFYCKGLHDVLMNRGQVLCSQSGSLFNCCIKKKKRDWSYVTGLEMSSRVFTATNTQRKLDVAVFSALSVCSPEEIQISRDHRWIICGLHFAHKLQKALRFLTTAISQDKSLFPLRQKRCVSAVACNHRLIVTQPRCY